MKKSIRSKIVFIIIFVVLMRIFLVYFLDYLNCTSTRKISSSDNIFAIESNSLHILDNIIMNSDFSKTFYIENKNHQNLSIFIDNLEFGHSIHINEKIVSQNIDKTKPDFDSKYSYKTFDINTSETIKVDIVGKGANKTKIYISSTKNMKNSLENRTIINIVMLMIILIVTVISLVFYVNNRKEKAFLIFIIMGIVSAIKLVNYGDIYSITIIFNLSYKNYMFIDRITTILNTFLPAVIMIYIFKFNIKFKYIVLFIMLCISTGVFTMLSKEWVLLYQLFYITVILIGVFMVSYAFIKEKRFANELLIINGIYFSLATYYIIVNFKIFEIGFLHFYINTAYLGVLIFIVGFLTLNILEYYKKNKELQEKEEQYERILLLRGLNHDIKHPLSIIKLNNQIIGKYELSTDERKDYIKNSLESVQELEKMIDNINTYLNPESYLNNNEKTNVKVAINKIQSYYRAFCKEFGYKLIVDKDDKDFILDIDSITFNRVLQNLLDNAFKYSGEDKEVKLSYKVLDKLIITVKDNGVGMEHEQVEKIFLSSYRGDKRKEGFGLGLSVVKNVIDSLNGEIKVETSKYKGTCIKLIIP